MSNLTKKSDGAICTNDLISVSLKIQLTLYTDLECLSWSMVLVRLYYTRVELVTGEADYLKLMFKAWGVD